MENILAILALLATVFLSIKSRGSMFGSCPFAMKVKHLSVHQYQFFLVCVISLLTANTAHAQARARPAQPVAAEAPASSCVIAEFRQVALLIHDPLERQNKAIEWLQKNGGSCSLMQMSILISSKASLLGTSDSVALGAVIDAIVEKKLGSDHAAVSRRYRPEVQGPAKGREEAPPAKTTMAGPGPKSPTDGPVAGAPAATVVAMASPTAAMPAPNININMGGVKQPEEDMSRKFPLPTEPMFVFPPEFGTPVINYFGKIRRQFVRSFFMETLSPGKCPEGMNWRNDACEASFKVAWKFGEKLPQGTKTYPIEPKLIEKLNFDPGYTFVRVGGDIFALERDTGKVADAVINLGKLS